MFGLSSMCSLSVLVFIFVVGPLVEMPGVEAGMCGCPPLWTGFNDHCYRYFSTVNISWIDAELRCRTFISTPCGDESSSSSVGHLVSVHSQDEMDFITGMFGSLRSKRQSQREVMVWIGLHDLIDEGSAEWVDGTPLDYTFWGNGQPNDQNGYSDCVIFSRNTAYKWDDIPCSSRSLVESFFCKIRQW